MEERITVKVGRAHAVVRLADTIAAKELLAQLPLEVKMKDFSSKEKIYVLPKSLSLTKSSQSSPRSGDVAYYIPWGNIAFFYNSTIEASADLEILGHFESGKELLNVKGSVDVLIERVNQ